MSILEKEKDITGIARRVNSNVFFRNSAEKLSALVPYQVEAWQTVNQQLDDSTQIRNILALAVSITILLVAGFGIYNIMNMTVNEKIKEIAILKAIGFDAKDIRSIFLQQALIIGVIGDLTGVVIGYCVSALVYRIPFTIAGLTTLPIDHHAADFVMALVFGLIISLIAGYLPSHKASKIDPVIIIRG